MYRSYPILSTDAFILHTRAVGEAHRSITVFTKDNGLMYLYARSIRKEGAKMRGTAMPYGRVFFSAVLGRQNILKEVSVIDTFAAIWSDGVKYSSLVTLLHSVRTYVPVAESYDSDIFMILESVAHFLKERESAHAPHILLVAQVMLFTALGYVPDRTLVVSRFADILQLVIDSPEMHNEFCHYHDNALRYQ